MTSNLKKNLIVFCRIAVGLLFIFSGLIKANDPLGLSYKMQEFFEVWGWPGFDAYTLFLSVVMIVFEILAGVALLLGWRMRLFSWLLLLLMIFFIFLTGYAAFSGKIRECGCFGNCIPLQAMGSFLKDLALMAGILFLFANRGSIRSNLSPAVNISLLTLTVVFSFAIQWWVLHHLPLIDCLPYSKGANIQAGMKPPPGAIPDSTVITFRYEKNGRTEEYTADKLPSNLDSTWRFIDRYDKLIRKGNAEPAIRDFSLTTASGNDTTADLLTQPGYTILIFSRAFPEKNPGWNQPFSVLLSLARTKKIPVFIVTSARDQADAYLQANGLGVSIPVLACDAVAVKTAARTDPATFLLKKGSITNKWGAADMPGAVLALGEISNP